MRKGADLEASVSLDLDLALGDVAPEDVRHAVDDADAGTRVSPVDLR